MAQSFEQVLANINKLNRSLEAVIAVGHEFSSVEALWSQFEGVMGKDATAAAAPAHGDGDGSAAAKESRKAPQDEGQTGGGVKAEEPAEDETMTG